MEKKLHRTVTEESLTSGQLDKIFECSFDVFISYQWKHQELVKKIKNKLDSENIKSWMDIGEMASCDELYTAIEKGIRAAKVVIVCISNEYALSTNCNREINLAADLKKMIIPIIVSNGVEWPPKGIATAIAGKVYIDFSDPSKFDENMAVLIEKTDSLLHSTNSL